MGKQPVFSLSAWLFGAASLAGMVVAILSYLDPWVVPWIMGLTGWSKLATVATLVGIFAFLAGIVAWLICKHEGKGGLHGPSETAPLPGANQDVVKSGVPRPEVTSALPGQAVVSAGEMRSALTRECKRLRQFVGQCQRDIIRESSVDEDAVRYHMRAVRTVSTCAAEWAEVLRRKAALASAEWALPVGEYRAIVEELGCVVKVLGDANNDPISKLDMAAGRLCKLNDRIGRIQRSLRSRKGHR